MKIRITRFYGYHLLNTVLPVSERKGERVRRNPYPPTPTHPPPTPPPHPHPTAVQVVILGLLCFIVFSLERRDLSDRLGETRSNSLLTACWPCRLAVALGPSATLSPPAFYTLIDAPTLSCRRMDASWAVAAPTAVPVASRGWRPECPGWLRRAGPADPAAPCCAVLCCTMLCRHRGHALSVDGGSAVCYPGGAARQLLHTAHTGEALDAWGSPVMQHNAVLACRSRCHTTPGGWVSRARMFASREL